MGWEYKDSNEHYETGFIGTIQDSMAQTTHCHVSALIVGKVYKAMGGGARVKNVTISQHKNPKQGRVHGIF